MKRLADERGVCMLLVHHLTKSRSDGPFEQFAGSVGLTAAADTLLHLGRRRGDERCVLRTTGRDVEEVELPLAFTKGRFALDQKETEAPLPTPLSPERQAILEFVRNAAGPVPPRSVAATLGRHPGGTRALMMQMRRQGALVRVEAGYVVPPGEAAPAPATPSNIVPFRARRPHSSTEPRTL